MSDHRPIARAKRPSQRGSRERSHVALTGLMGAGKSTVGRLLAERLGYAFVDLDEVIAEAAGKDIPSIFRDHGEVGFRARERAALREVLSRKAPQLIATGGGTFVDPTMRSWLLEQARTIYLHASPETLAARVAALEARARRPLLRGPDPRATLKRLLAERASAYEASDHTLGTESLSPEEVAFEALRLLHGTLPPMPGAASAHDTMTAEPAASAPKRTYALPDAPVVTSTTEPMAASTAVIPVQAKLGDYQVTVLTSEGDAVAEQVLRHARGRHLAVVTDETVMHLHANRLAEILRGAGKTVTVLAVPPGETSKSLERAGWLFDELSAAGFERTDTIVAVGGGVVCDLAGFVASTFLRGIPLVQVPTTTLAALDASVGSKTAVNTPRGKNLVGTFYPPKAVVVSVPHLATQPPREHAAGLAEAVKMAACLDEALFHLIADHATELANFLPHRVQAVLHRAIAIKARVVSADEHEAGPRLVLNYGHTIGHAIEQGEHFRLLHGEAVALGMVAEAEWAELELGVRDVVAPLVRVLEALGLPVRWREAHVALDSMRLDKKRLGGALRLAVVTSIGHHEVRTVPMATLEEFIRRRSGT